MVMKIIDVPEGVTQINLYNPKVGTYPVAYLLAADLPDAPTVAENATVEKRVIELPADMIRELNVYKNSREFISVFLFIKHMDGALRNHIVTVLPEKDKKDWVDIVSSWYLDHVEFVPKKEPMFVVEVDRHEYIYASFIGSAIGKKTVDFWKIPQEVTEEEADELVAGLTALNARKVKVDE